jgi:hypothetical protein
MLETFGPTFQPPGREKGLEMELIISHSFVIDYQVTEFGELLGW